MSTRFTRALRRRVLALKEVQRRYLAEEASHRRELRNRLVKYAWRAFWAFQFVGFCYGYWLGIQLIHKSYGGGP